MGRLTPTIIIGDVGIDPDKFLFPRQIIGKAPTFTVSEVAKFFFARSPSWLRELERKATLDGKPFSDRGQHGVERRYTFYDIERLAHAFAESNFITGERLRLALKVLRVEAAMWRYLPED